MSFHNCPQVCPQELWIVVIAGGAIDVGRRRAVSSRRCRNGTARQPFCVAIFSPCLRQAPPLQRIRRLPTPLSAGLSTAVVDNENRLAKKSPNMPEALPRLGCGTLSTALPQRFSTTFVETAVLPVRGCASVPGCMPWLPINVHSPSR